MEKADVIIIGAGPSGAVAGALLARQGFDTLILEKQQFPRFSIGESLLPQCMEFLAEADMLDAVNTAGFQHKNGALFVCGEKCTGFDFSEKFTPGPATTFQVQRARFDKLLADEAEKSGARVRYREAIVAADFHNESPTVCSVTHDGIKHRYQCRFVLDASGFGRILPRLLDLEVPSGFPVRQSVFTHIEDRISDSSFDRNKILITVHPRHADVWYWLIPFADGRSSLGVVAEAEFLATMGDKPDAILKNLIAQAPGLNALLVDALYDTPVNQITGYAANVKSLIGPGYALLGNAGEFLDPVFSSGVTIALKSASLAAATLARQLNGEAVSWQDDFVIPLKSGVDTFRCYVESWYNRSFQEVIFHHTQPSDIKSKICSVLAGYAWDGRNPYVKGARRKINLLAEICRRNLN